MRTARASCKLTRQYTAQFYRHNKVSFALAVVSTTLIGGMNLLLAWLMQQMIDTISQVPGAYTLRQLIGFTAGCILLILCFKTISYFSLPRFMKKAMGQYKSFILEKLVKKSISSFHQESTSAYLSALSNDALRIETDYLAKCFTLIQNTVLFFGAIVMMLIYSPLLTLIAVAFFSLPILAALATGSRVEQAESLISHKNAGFISILKDCLSGFPVIKSFRAEDAIVKLLRDSNDSVESAKCRRRKLTTILGTLGGIAGVTAQFGTFLAGGYLVLSGAHITAGVLMIFIDLTADVINPLRELPELLACRKAALGLVDKLASQLETHLREEGADVPCVLREGISLEQVSFAYEGGESVLRDIDVKFEAGKCYAIVGSSGSGKSTLLNLLMAAHDNYSGMIRYDGAELRSISSGSLYDLVSIVQQNVFVFNATIRENITMFQNFPQQEVDSVIQLAGLSELIDNRGEDFLCGESGYNLSGGEKQRISIARSLLRKSSVLLVDEATSALDAKTACQVSESILRLKSLTRIVVTHALDEQLLQQYDCILVLHGGQIEEMGTFNQLMGTGGYFHSLYTVSHE